MSNVVKDRPIRVLLVEDNPGDVGLIREALRDVDGGLFALSQVGRLDQALEVLAVTEIDVLLLDLELPDSTGLETFTRARERGGDEPIVVISGRDDESIALEAVRSGAQDYIVKDRISSHVLLRVIQYAIERKRIEQHRRVVERGQMMEAVGRLASGMAHDFNNVLTAILGHADLISQWLSPGERIHRDVLEIKKAAKRAAGLTNQLLAFSRQQALEMTLVDLKALIEDLERILRRVVGDEVGLELSVARDLGRVRADPSQLEQVIVNLILNARDALKSGGKIRIEVENAEVSADRKDLPALRPGRYVVLRVVDDGVGMDRQTAARIFEPFFTSKEKGQGDGLGLSTVYGIIRQHGGDITVQSRLGHGTTFSVYLPWIGIPADSLPKLDGADLRTVGETILVAEDDELLLPLIKGSLIRKGYTVLAATTAEQALALGRQHADRIDLLITDVLLPQMGGRQLAEQLVELRPEIKVLYISGHTGDGIGHGEGGRRPQFLQKPFTPATLAAKVRETLSNPELR